MIYLCEECGYWTQPGFMDSLKIGMVDAGLSESPDDVRRAALASAATSNYDCPSGHGKMSLVLSEDRLARREKRDTEPNLKIVKTETAVEEQTDG